MSEPVTFLATLPFPSTAMRVMGDGGYVVYLHIPEDELGAVMQLMLMRQSVIQITATNLGAQPVKPKNGKAKPKKRTIPEDDHDGT